jgi:hypothetical protein
MAEKKEMSLSGADIFTAYVMGMAVEVDGEMFIVTDNRVIRVVGKAEEVKCTTDTVQECVFTGVLEDDHEGLPKEVLAMLEKAE